MKLNTKKGVLVGVLVLLLCISSFLVYGGLFTTYYTFPEKYEENGGLVNLGLFSSGPNNSLDYFPGGYGVYVKKGDNGRILTTFQIKNPALHQSEIYSNGKVCQKLNVPVDCWSVYYSFKWTDASGDELTSTFPVYQNSTDYVDVIEDIKQNALKTTSQGAQKVSISKIEINDVTQRMLVKVYFGDDVEIFHATAVTNYKDISKKFSFRVNTDEVKYIGVASSDKKYFDPTTGLVNAMSLSKLNFASIHLAANASNTFQYKARLDPGKNFANIITVDMDNSSIDPSSNPPMNTYVDVFLIEERNGNYVIVDKDGNETTEPLYRISPNANGISSKGIPAVTGNTKWIRGPSGSFVCKSASLGAPGFQACYDAMQQKGTMGISQHKLDFTASTKIRALLVKVNNSSSNVGNAFAIGSDLDFMSDQIPYKDIIPKTGNDNENENTNGYPLKATTSVEIDPYNGLDFSDDQKITKSGNTHTYKLELCNIGTNTLTDVFTRLHIPNNTTLIGSDTPSEIPKSSFMEDSSNLDTTIDVSKKIATTIFNGEIGIGSLDVLKCKFFTYQIDIPETAKNGDVFTVKNESKYGTGSYTYTNEVKNAVFMSTGVTFGLESNPISGSEVVNGDRIEYRVTVKNDGDIPIGSGSIVCPRMQDTDFTQCKLGECKEAYYFDTIPVGQSLSFSYIVDVKDEKSVPVGTKIIEQCKLNDTQPSNTVDHTVKAKSNDVVGGGKFTLEITTRPKLLNSPDGNPRPDEYDKAPIRYAYKYSGSQITPMYPSNSDPSSYLLSRGGCGPITLPYTPNSYTYNANSSSFSARDYLNLGSNDLVFSLNTTLPSDKPKTILAGGSLTPQHSVAGNELNNWYQNGGIKNLPTSATIHRAVVNGPSGVVESIISGTMNLDKWQYRAYSTATCSYICGCSKKGCWSCSVSYPLYRWEFISTQNIPFTDTDNKYVTVGGSTAWIKTEGANVHTNTSLTENGTTSNQYDLGEDGFTNVSSAPKLYSPPGSYHGEYVVSSNSSSSNLKSEKGWYVYNKKVKMGHGYVYDREKNPRDFYTDLLVGEKFGKVNKTGLPSTIKDFSLKLNNIYYWPGDLTINNPTGTSIFSGFKGTLVIGGNLYIKSNIKYSQEVKKRVEDLVYLGIIVKGSVYIDPSVTETSGTWFVEGTLHTGESVKTLHHLGSWTARSFDFQRKAPEFYERDVNEPSERILFDDRVYVTTPPGFAELDDGSWSYNFNVNQFSGEIIGY